MQTRSKRKKALSIDEPTKHRRIQSESWNPDWGYGADFIEWRNKQRDQTVNLSGDGSSSSSNKEHEVIDLTREVIDLTGDTVDELKAKYKKEFPKGTPLACACEYGRFEDVKVLITGYNDVNGINGNNNNNMTLKEYVNQEGKDSDGDDYTPLMIAARYEHFQIVKYLIEQGEADPNIANSKGWNALHLAARYNKKDTKVIELL